MPIKKVVKKFNFPKNDLIKLVLDIDDYKEFLPWCKSSKILKIDEDSIQKIIHADLEIGYKLITDTYTSEVVFDKKKSESIHDMVLSMQVRKQKQRHTFNLQTFSKKILKNCYPREAILQKSAFF